MQRTGSGSRHFLALRWAIRAVVAGLVILHLALLAKRVADATILEPSVLARWLTSVLVLLLIGALHARGIVPWHGRAGLVLALIVLLLHVGGPSPTPVPTFVFVLPAGVVLAATTVLAVLCRLDFDPATVAAGDRTGWHLRLAPPRPDSAFVARYCFAPRPPPSA